MNDNDKRRIEDAIWTLLQYQHEIKEMSPDLKIDQSEIAGMFITMHLVYAKISE